ncbi:MAG TPA: MJ0042-type zinc finger domain-containing protein [Xanthobacteraceae bacterium]|nr:MJ0042-type zinc finger domain-containing protein [Xanthobacteraceae bacterium]
MLIVCPTCATTYQIKAGALGEAGRTVRCASCKNTWFASPESAVMEEAAPATAAAVGAAAAAEKPPADDAAAGFDGGFGVETAAPIDDPAAAQEAARALAVTDAPPLAPTDSADRDAAAAARKFDPGTPDDIETIAARRARHTYSDRKQKLTLRQRILSVPTLIVVLAAILIGALNFRAAMVRHFPQTASLFSLLGLPVNLRGLSFMDVKSRGEFVDGAMVLVIEGTIVNLTPHPLEVPRLRFGLRNSAGHEVYAWTALPTKSTLGSGDGLAFRTRLASPPADGRDVIVRFFSRRDAGLGLGS